MTGARSLDESLAAARAVIDQHPKRRRPIKGPHIYRRGGVWQAYCGDGKRVSLHTSDEQVALAAFEAMGLSRRKDTERGTDRGVVYFARAGYEGPVKIGFTARLDQRLADLSTTASAPLRVLAALPGTRATETEMHRRFAAHCVHREWFDARVVMAFLDALTAAALAAAGDVAGPAPEAPSPTPPHTPSRGGRR